MNGRILYDIHFWDLRDRAYYWRLAGITMIVMEACEAARACGIGAQGRPRNIKRR